MKARPGRRTRSHGPSDDNGENHSASVNMLCIIGAIIGVFSALLPWVWAGEGAWQTDLPSAYDVLLSPRDSNHGWWDDAFATSQVIFISGTVLSFIFPAACGIQGIGIVAFFIEHTRRDSWLPYEFGLSIGFYVAIASTALVAVGLIAPFGIGLDASKGQWSKRLWTVCRMSEGGGLEASRFLTSLQNVLHALRGNRKWAAVLLTTLISLSALSYQSNMTDYDGSVDYVDGRVAISIGDSATVVHWGLTKLNVSDGSESAEWAFEVGYDEYGYHDWTPPTLEAKDLGELSVVPQVVDHSGEGIVTQGDRIIISPQNGSSFAENTEYQAAVIEVPYALDVPLRHLYVSFELVDDGISYEFETVQTEGWSLHIDGPFWLLAYGAVVALVVSSTMAYRKLVTMFQRPGDRRP